MSQLPRGWTETTLARLMDGGLFVDGDWVETKDQDGDGEVRLTQLADVGEGYWRNRSNRSMKRESAMRLNCTYLEKGDVLVARMPDPLGRACIFPGDTRPAVTVVDVCVLRPHSGSANSKWLMWFLNAPPMRAKILALQSGTTRKRISKTNLGSLTIPVPPVAEQQRIVEVIEEHFSRLDAAEASLRVALQKLGRHHFATVLAETHRGGGRLTKLKHVVDVLDSQRVPINSKAREIRKGAIPYYGATGQVGWIDKPLFDEDLTLLGEDGAPFLDRLRAKAYVISGPTWVNNHAHVLRARPGVITNRFLAYALNCVDYQRYVNGTTRLKLTQGAMKEIEIPVPSVDHQAIIVEKIDRAISANEHMQESIAAAFQKTRSLRRSLLGAAFSGRLGPWPGGDGAGQPFPGTIFPGAQIPFRYAAPYGADGSREGSR